MNNKKDMFSLGAISNKKLHKKMQSLSFGTFCCNKRLQKKAQSGIITVPLETKVEVVMILLFVFSATLMMAGIFQSDEYVHQYFKKDVSMVQNTLVMIPFDTKFFYNDHSVNKDMDKIAFTIDNYYTSTISRTFESYREEGGTRDYIHLTNDNVLPYKATYVPGDIIYFKKEFGKFTVGKNDISSPELTFCDLSKVVNYNEYNIHLHVNDAVYSILSNDVPNLFRYPIQTLTGKNLYLKIDRSVSDKFTINIPNEGRNDLGCRIYNKFSGDVIYNNDFFRDYRYLAYDQVAIIKVPRSKESDFFKELKVILK